MEATVLCRNCFQTFPAPQALADDALVCPRCGTDVLTSLKEEVKALIARCGTDAIRRAGQLSPLPREAVASLTRLWEEVRWSFILGQYSAALTLGCAFLEFVLERALGVSEEMTLTPAIKRCREAGLIDTTTTDKLLETAWRVRNAYAHGDYHKIARPGRAVSITSGKIVQGELVLDKPSERPLGDLPDVQVIVKGHMDVVYAQPVLQYIRMVANDLVQRVPRLRRQPGKEDGEPGVVGEAGT